MNHKGLPSFVFDETATGTPEDGEKGIFLEFIRRSWLEYAKDLQGEQGAEYARLEDAVEVQRVLDAVERSAAQGGSSIKLH